MDDWNRRHPRGSLRLDQDPTNTEEVKEVEITSLSGHSDVRENPLPPRDRTRPERKVGVSPGDPATRHGWDDNLNRIPPPTKRFTPAVRKDPPHLFIRNPGLRCRRGGLPSYSTGEYVRTETVPDSNPDGVATNLVQYRSTEEIFS